MEEESTKKYIELVRNLIKSYKKIVDEIGEFRPDMDDELIKRKNMYKNAIDKQCLEHIKGLELAQYMSIEEIEEYINKEYQSSLSR